MGRIYKKIDCGCYVSHDKGGGLIPCNKSKSKCKFNKDFMMCVSRNEKGDRLNIEVFEK